MSIPEAIALGVVGLNVAALAAAVILAGRRMPPEDEPPVEEWRRAIEREDRHTMRTREDVHRRGLHTRWNLPGAP